MTARGHRGQAVLSTRRARWFDAGTVFLCLVGVAIGTSAFAQNQGLIVRDDSLGGLQGQPIPPSANGLIDYDIQPGYGQQVGQNLFHSFSAFGVGVGENARFTTDIGVRNVIVRVTGSDPSVIAGLLSINRNLAAALFLMNPNGVLFTDTASIDLPATSLHIGSSRWLEMQGGFAFEASSEQDVSLLSMEPVVDRPFLAGASARLTVAGARIASAFDVSLTGLDVHVSSGAMIEPNALSPGANILLAAKRDLVITGLTTVVGFDQSLIMDQTAIRRIDSVSLFGQRVKIGGGAHVDASSFSTSTTPFVRSGDLRIEALESILLEGNAEFEADWTVIRSQQLNRSALDSDGFTLVELSAPTIALRGTARISGTTGGFVDAAGITLDADLITLSDGAKIESNAYGAGGGAGAIAMRAQTVSISNGADVSTLVDTALPSDVGSIRIEGNVIEVDHASIRTNSPNGGGGNIDLAASRRFEIEGGTINASVAAGEGGSIRIDSGQTLLVRGDSSIVANAASPGGQGGQITLSAPAALIEASTLVDASAPGGPEAQGNVVLGRQLVNLEPGPEPLSTPWLEPRTLLGPECDAETDPSSLIVQEILLIAPGDLARADQQTTGERSVPIHATGAIEAREALSAGEFDASLALVEQVVAPDKSTLSTDVLIHLGETSTGVALASEGDRRGRAIRLAHRTLERARLSAEATGDRRSESYVWGAMATLYAAERRWSEAAELNGLAIEFGATLTPDAASHRWIWQSARIARAQGRADFALAEYRRAIESASTLRSMQALQGRAVSLHQLRELYIEYIGFLLESRPERESLPQARLLMDRLRVQDIREYFGDPCLGGSTLDRVPEWVADDRAAMLTVIPLEDRVVLLLSHGDHIELASSAITRDELIQKSRRLRTALEKPFTRQYLEPARALHAALISPIESSLAALSVSTLVIATDGVLSTIPFAALHDGERFLIERYAVATSAGAGVVSVPGNSFRGGSIVAAGIARGTSGASDLSFVTAELGVAIDRFGGELLLDDSFTPGRLAEALREVEPSILHIASHAEYAGTIDGSTIETSAGPLRLEDVSRITREASRRGSPIQLLVLSACETAAGGEHGALGLLGTALDAGAESAIGSLWAVSDESTSALVESLYRGLSRPDVSRAQALRDAQRDLLARPTRAHPYYWAGFILVSDWR